MGAYRANCKVIFLGLIKTSFEYKIYRREYIFSAHSCNTLHSRSGNMYYVTHSFITRYHARVNHWSAVDFSDEVGQMLNWHKWKFWRFSFGSIIWGIVACENGRKYWWLLKTSPWKASLTTLSQCVCDVTRQVHQLMLLCKWEAFFCYNCSLICQRTEQLFLSDANEAALYIKWSFVDMEIRLYLIAELQSICCVLSTFS